MENGETLATTSQQQQQEGRIPNPEYSFEFHQSLFVRVEIL
jgi:hypothetical protein